MDRVVFNTWASDTKHLVSASSETYTWNSPGDGTKNQIDYITINERFRNSGTQVKSYPTVRVKLRKLMINESQPKLQTDLVRSENEYRQKFHQQVSACIRDMVRTTEMETRYTEFSNILIEATEQVVPVDIRRANQRWMTNEILDMMEERRLLKHNQGLYRQKDAEIQRECHKGKEKMLSQQCDLIEQLDAANQSNLMYAQIRKTIGSHKGNPTTTCIEDERWQH